MNSSPPMVVGSRPDGTWAVAHVELVKPCAVVVGLERRLDAAVHTVAVGIALVVDGIALGVVEAA